MKNLIFLLSRSLIILLVLFIAGCTTVPQQTSTTTGPGGTYHIVEKGQTLWGIAKTYDTDVNKIIRMNKISDPTKLEVGQRLLIPKTGMPFPVEPCGPVNQELINKLVGPRYRVSKWRSITVHHSATLEGNAECFDRNHRARGMGGLFYHFVIGNGTGSGDGEIEVGWRWKQQNYVNRPFDIQICLVGNFNRQEVSEAQFKSLVGLTATLCKQYNISLKNIRGHKDIASKVTECPGQNFPFNEFMSALRNFTS